MTDNAGDPGCVACNVIEVARDYRAVATLDEMKDALGMFLLPEAGSG